MSHGDKVDIIPDGFETIAKSDNCVNATIQNLEKMILEFSFIQKLSIRQMENKC